MFDKQYYKAALERDMRDCDRYGAYALAISMMRQVAEERLYSADAKVERFHAILEALSDALHKEVPDVR